MVSLAAAALSLLPLYPLNPVRQDTVSAMNMHFTADITSPNELVAASFGVSLKCEMLIIQPLVVRGALEYDYGPIFTHRYPRGDLHTVTPAIELLYYHGTDKLSGFIGGGAFLSAHMFALEKYSADSLQTYEQIEDVDISQSFGYRLIFGLRFDRSYSLELSFSETRPDYIYSQRLGPSSFKRYREQLHFNNVSISIGYLLSLSHS